jgi:hypothetical protein
LIGRSSIAFPYMFGWRFPFHILFYGNGETKFPKTFGNVAKIAAERMEELAGSATLRDAGTIAGIATDKLLALSGELGGGVPVQILLSAGAEALHAKYAQMVREIEALPNPRGTRAQRGERRGRVN